MDILTFDDLITLRADAWNLMVAECYNLSVEELKEHIYHRDIRLINDRISKRINKAHFDPFVTEQRKIDKENVIEFTNGNKDVIYDKTLIDSFTVKITNTDDIVESISLLGKIIIGANFNKSNLSNSYFCGCTFYNCDLSQIDFGNSVFVLCDFVNCYINKTDFNGSTISKCNFFECNIINSKMDYTVFSDCMFVESNLQNSSLVQSRLLYSAFDDCNLTYVNWGDSDIVQVVIGNSDCKHSDFKRVTLVDSILLHSDFFECNLDSIIVTCITVSKTKYDPKYKSFFETDRLSYSPSLHEWEPIQNDDDDDNPILNM